ncbi:hypothetical protein TSAR_016055 [Trichomalopsis sarcophagae]|uniref:Uncharacterized protein n=1 Tax=Trichomalopsis sarcophagae TaxID=543379 RepID=A0A232F8X4_9HYME|nr:hypothetical protein TSAR_016055 [Trichomalopsis sarcophagae]
MCTHALSWTSIPLSNSIPRIFVEMVYFERLLREISVASVSLGADDRNCENLLPRASRRARRIMRSLMRRCRPKCARILIKIKSLPQNFLRHK